MSLLSALSCCCRFTKVAVIIVVVVDVVGGSGQEVGGVRLFHCARAEMRIEERAQSGRDHC